MKCELPFLLALVGALYCVEFANSVEPSKMHRRFLDYVTVGSYATLGYAGNGDTVQIRLLTANQVEQRKEAFTRYDKQTGQIRRELDRIRNARREGQRGDSSVNSEERRLLIELSRITRPQDVYRIVTVGADFVEMRIAVQPAMETKEDERSVVLAATHIGRIDIPAQMSRSATSGDNPTTTKSRRESYKVGQADAESIAEVIKEVYRDVKGIEITVNTQRNAIVVVAPEEVHGIVRMLINSDTDRPVLLVPPWSTHPGDSVERGMKADELEWKMRFQWPFKSPYSQFIPVPIDQRPTPPPR